MKKIKLLFAGIFITALSLTSCSSNESIVEAPESVEFAKTTEMLNFERSLKTYFQTKQEFSANSKQKSQASEETVKVANELLTSLGKTDLAKQTEQNPDLLIRTAMKEYSKKLTEMYNQQKNN
jgi:uncharacterized protein YcfL